MIRKLTAPWTLQQVAELNRSQRGDPFRHEYTCGNHHEGDRTLIATEAGWVCPSCDYTQDWFRAYVMGRVGFVAEPEAAS
jgi:hypothetical protein